MVSLSNHAPSVALRQAQGDTPYVPFTNGTVYFFCISAKLYPSSVSSISSIPSLSSLRRMRYARTLCPHRRIHPLTPLRLRLARVAVDGVWHAARVVLLCR